MAVPEDIDALYRPLGGAEGWSGAPVNQAAWERDVLRLQHLGREEPALADMVARGCLLAAAYQSGALAGVHGGDRGLTLALVSGVASLAAVALGEPDYPGAPQHVRANFAALCLARAAPADPSFPSPAWVRHAHAVACGPQQVHLVHTEAGWQDHVLAHGDYKHHPNHQRTETGGWRPLAPVTELEREIGRLDETLRSDAFHQLHPVAQAAYALHAVVHIGPFAVGNGRAGRALASAFLLRTGGLPLVVFADEAHGYADALDGADARRPSALISFIERCCSNTADLVASAATSPGHALALDRWRRRVRAAHQLHALLPAAVNGALGRHRRRQDLRWRSDLADAVVLPTTGPASHDRFDEQPLTVRVPVGDGAAVEEVLRIDAHPLALEDREVLLRAEQAAHELEAPPAELIDGGDVATRLEPWLDRVMMSLAVRVAAKLE